jgi:hypothetical protein
MVTMRLRQEGLTWHVAGDDVDDERADLADSLAELRERNLLVA